MLNPGLRLGSLFGREQNSSIVKTWIRTSSHEARFIIFSIGVYTFLKGIGCLVSVHTDDVDAEGLGVESRDEERCYGRANAFEDSIRDGRIPKNMATHRQSPPWHRSRERRRSALWWEGR